ncbi:hypothetical protein EFZ10_15480 [Tatumella sp. TA1]|nr:hypothetical protein EFZ10_15480 [Tatumella sp. TA1]
MPIGKVKKISDDSFSIIENITKDFSFSITKIISELQKNIATTLKLEKRTKEHILLSANKLLTDNPIISGAGFLLYDPNIINSWQVTWLYRPEYLSTSNRLALNKASQPLLDYHTFSWFAKAKESGKGYLHGPYVDYVCNASYTLTYLFPLYEGKQLIGIAATDILVGKLEQIIRDTLAHDRTPIVMATPDGRVLFSNHSHYRVGDIHHPAPLMRTLNSSHFVLWIAADK